MTGITSGKQAFQPKEELKKQILQYQASRWQKRNPSQEIILVGSLNSVLHHADVMDESTSLFVETSPFTSEDFGLSDNPDIPAGNEHYF